MTVHRPHPGDIRKPNGIEKYNVQSELHQQNCELGDRIPGQMREYRGGSAPRKFGDAC